MAITKYFLQGQVFEETPIVSLFRGLGKDEITRGWGLTISAGGGLNADVEAGGLIAEGYTIVNDATVSVAVQPSQTNYIFMDKEGVITSSITPSYPTGGVLLGVVVTDATSVTSVTAPTGSNPGDRRRVFSTKRITESRSSTTLTVDADFSFKGEAGDVWLAKYTLRTESGVTQGFRLDLDLAAGQEATYSLLAMNPGGNASDGRHDHGTPPNNIFVDYFGTDMIIEFQALVIVNTTQQINLRWAPASGGGPARVNIGSFMVAERLY